MERKRFDIIKKVFQQNLSASTDVPKLSFKSSKVSNDFRIKGNKRYSNKNYDQNSEETFNIYSKSVAYAPPNSEDLELAYGNRSAILQRMKKHEESILDINRALAIGKSKLDFKIKILCRKVECLAALGSQECFKVHSEIKFLVSQLDDQSNNNNSNNPLIRLINKASEALKNFEAQISTENVEEIPEHIKILKGKEIQNPSSMYNIQVDKVVGRQLVASKDIKPGEIIFVERPYVSCVKISNFANYCGHCIKKTWTCIPCDYCNWCMFCSENCKELAFLNYHDIECLVISYMISLETDFDYCDQLSLRSLIIGMREAGNIQNFIAELKITEDWLDNYEKGYIKDVVCYSSGFKSVYTLGRKISNDHFEKYVKTVDKMLFLLATCTQFFGKNLELSDLSQNENVIFVKLTLVKLMQKFNAFALKFQNEKLKKRGKNDVKNLDDNLFWGACVTPVISFMNHSCNPNAKVCFNNDNKLIVYSLQPIKKNDHILVGYQNTFYEMKKQIRSNWMTTFFNCVCDCEACANDWPTLDELYEMPKVRPHQYAMTFSKKESNLFDENDALVRPIMYGNDKVRFNQKTVECIVKAMDKASKCLKQPSVVMCELIISLSITFEKLYGYNLLR